MKDIVQEIRRGKGSLYAFLIKVFAGLICLIVLLGLLLFSVSELLRQKLYTQPQSAKLLSQEDLLKKEDYGSIHVGNSLGKTGYFEKGRMPIRKIPCGIYPIWMRTRRT